MYVMFQSRQNWAVPIEIPYTLAGNWMWGKAGRAWSRTPIWDVGIIGCGLTHCDMPLIPHLINLFFIYTNVNVYTHTHISFIYICKTFESHWRLIEQILQQSSSKDKEILLNNYNTMIVFGHLTLRPLSNLLLILNFSNYLNNMFYNCFFFQSTFNWESHDVFTYYVSSSLEWLFGLSSV